MPAYIIKAPERDEYVMWSTVCAFPESPVLSRSEMEQWCRDIGIPNPETWLTRADKLGTSDISEQAEQYLLYDLPGNRGHIEGTVPNEQIIDVWKAVLDFPYDLLHSNI